MRINGLFMAIGGIALGACAGGEKSASTPGGGSSAPVAAPGAAVPASGGLAAAPVTGKMIDVNMIGDPKGGYHFVPSSITLKEGDGITFHVVSGPPHNVGFDPATVPADVQPQLIANMPGDHVMGPLEGPLDAQIGGTYTISFAKIKPGTYGLHCTPHLALNMKGTITVQ